MNFKQFKNAINIYFKLLLKLEKEEEGLDKGAIIMKITSEDDFKNKMRSLGAFITDEVTIIQNPSPIIPKKVVSKFKEPKINNSI